MKRQKAADRLRTSVGSGLRPLLKMDLLTSAKAAVRWLTYRRLVSAGDYWGEENKHTRQVPRGTESCLTAGVAQAKPAGIGGWNLP